MAGVELVEDRATRKPFDPSLGVGPYCMQRAMDRGVVLRALGDTIAFSPPLIVTESEIDIALDRFAGALQDTAAWLSDR